MMAAAAAMATRVTVAMTMPSHLDHGVIGRRQRRYAEPCRGIIRRGQDREHRGGRNQCESFHRNVLQWPHSCVPETQLLCAMIVPRRAYQPATHMLRKPNG
jgi:hypothetical protein